MHMATRRQERSLWRPDHKTFATVSRFTPYGPGSFVCIWDAATGKELRHFADPDFEPYQAFFLKKENLLGVFGSLT